MAQNSQTVRASAAYGPLQAAFRDAEARGLDIEAALPRLVAGRSLADAVDVAAVLHGRVDRWTQAAGGRNRQADNLIAGLIPRIAACERPRAGARAESSVTRPWKGEPVHWPTKPWSPARVGYNVSGPRQLPRPGAKRWIREVSTIAAYRDRWHLSGQNPVGKLGNTISIEQTSQRQRALAAADRATALSRVESNQSRTIVALRYKRTLTREEASSCEQAHECEGDGPMG